MYFPSSKDDSFLFFFFLFLNNSRYTVSSSHFERIVNVLKIAYSDLSFNDVIHLPRYLRFFLYGTAINAN